MTDQLMDERLRAAGERWRTSAADGVADAIAAANETAGTPSADFDVLPDPPRHRRWVSSTAAAGLAAAAVIAALLITGIVVVTHRNASPAAGGRADFATVAGVVWHLSEVRTADGSSVPAPHVTLEFAADGTFGADDQCNHLSGRVLAHGPTLTFPQTGTTDVGCTGPSLVVTNGIFRIGTIDWSRTGDRLTLSKPGVGALVYRRDPATSLYGTDWALVALVDSAGKSRALDNNSTLQIAASGTLLADDGVNAINAHVRVHGPSIALGEVTVGAVGGTTSSVVTESVDALLSGTIYYAIDGDTLTLSKPGGPTLSYRPRATVAASELSARVWTLRSVEVTTGGATSSATAISLSRLTFDGKGGFTVQHTCYTNQGRVNASQQTIRLTGVRLKVAVPCASTAETAAAQRENGVVDSLLTGTVTWAVEGTTLTITKAHRALTFAAK